MSAYLLCRVSIRDKDEYAKYTPLVPPLVERYGGRFLARGGASHVLEGAGFEGRLVVVEFPSVADARAFYDCDEYQAAKAIRAPVSEAEFMVVEGVVG